ncbi:MAG: deoxyribose-phosphate aldolase [Spirochaetales bacterium]|nr:deoxyribose-phosphate aldolase [Spirochaetales bacterium]MCF7937499.1 deoxyribose-phosphate aldolase [Spirochaetales bacterium]
MKLSAQDIARLIDISAVQTSHGKKEIDELTEIAKEQGFVAVHALPSWVSYVRDRLQGSEVMVGGPAGFPSGGNTTEVKVLEAEMLIRDGADEVDMMMNVGKLKSEEDDYVLNDISRVVSAAGNVPVKVILEISYLTDKEIERACELCIRAGAAFVKTGTGWTPAGTTLERVKLICGIVDGRIGIKAAGGIRGLSMLTQFYRLGVSRFGINAQASLDILREVQQLPGGVVEV